MTLSPAGYLGLVGLAAVGGLVGFGIGSLVSKDTLVKSAVALAGAVAAPAGVYAAVSSVNIQVGAGALPSRPPITILLGFPNARRA
jgi:hypothetical protein